MSGGLNTLTQGAADRSFIEDARWFARDADLSAGTLSFVHTEPEALAAEAFLDQFWDSTALTQRRLPIAAALEAMRGEGASPRLNFVWHTGYCCSTAVAKALDASGENLSLCEPHILVRAADARRNAARLRQKAPVALIDLVFRLLGRPFSEDGAITLKPAPVANCLLPEAAARTRGKMLFLYSDCRSFLLSAMRRSENRRRYIRSLFTAILADGNAPGAWPAERVATLTDLEVAALAWQLQIAEFRRHQSVLGDRAVSLDCDALLAEPDAVLAKLYDFFGLPGAPRGGFAVDFLSRDAKRPSESFDPGERRKILETLDPLRREELDAVVRGSYDLFASTPRGTPLANPLATTDKVYCP